MIGPNQPFGGFVYPHDIMKSLRENLEGAERDLHHAYRRWGEVGEWDDSSLFGGAG